VPGDGTISLMSREITRTRTGWAAPAGLIALSAVPVIAGGARVTGGALSAPLMLHIIGATVFCVLGALQFAPRLRHVGWHRVAGRLLVPCGLIAALSGLWLTLSHQLPESVVLTGSRLVFGSAMAVFLVLGVTAIRRRDIVGHRAWMTRGYAIGMGAGTQALTLALGSIALGQPDQLSRALLVTAGWVINLVVAERVIRKEKR
jgi:hypothetical protein